MGTDSIFVVYGATREMYDLLRSQIEGGRFRPLQPVACETYDLLTKAKDFDRHFYLYYPQYQKRGFAVREAYCVYLYVVWCEFEPFDGVPLEPCIHIHTGIRFQHADEYKPVVKDAKKIELMSEYTELPGFRRELLEYSRPRIAYMYLRQLFFRDLADLCSSY